ncbi:lipopolysaccharide heptosyltransferase II [bacterium]|nr:lipopolysaccharide heptosyltransferase II [bacterium]
MNRLLGSAVRAAAIVLGRRKRRTADQAPKRILVVKTHAIGDLLMVTPSIRAIRLLFPDAHISALTGKWSAPILVGNPDIDELLEFPDEALFGHKIGALSRLSRGLRALRFDLATIFQPSAPVQMLIALAGVPERIGFDLNGSGASLTRALAWSPNSERFIGDYYMDIPRALGFTGDAPHSVLALADEERAAASHKYLAPSLTQDDKIVAVCPGGGNNPRDSVPQKLWPAERFAHVAEVLARETGARILLLGGRADVDVLDAVASHLSHNAIRPVGTSLRELACLISSCDLIISNDSAPVHIAAALSVPCVAIYGPSNPHAVAPNASTSHIVASEAPCSPCYSNERFPGCAEPYCMEGISVDTVLEASRAALGIE